MLADLTVTSDEISLNVPQRQHGMVPQSSATKVGQHCPTSDVYCPVGGTCSEAIKMSTNNVMAATKATITGRLEQHIGVEHSTHPIVWFGVGTHSACLDLPLRQPFATGVEGGVCLVLRIKEELHFWVRVQHLHGDRSCKRATVGDDKNDVNAETRIDNNATTGASVILDTPTNIYTPVRCYLSLNHLRHLATIFEADTGAYFVTAFLQGDEATAAKYHLEVRIAVGAALTGRLQRGMATGIVSREIVARGTVHSLQKKSWQNVLQEHDGVQLSELSIASMFGGEAMANGSGVMMMVSIKGALE